MSQIGTGQLDISRRRRTPNIGPERTGITENLLAPGVVAQPPTLSSTANMLAQFDNAIGLAGQLASGIDSTIQRQRAMDARTQRAQDQIDAGAAFIDSSTDLTKDSQEISDLDLDYFIELNEAGQAFETIADTIFDIRTEGMSDAYKQQYIQSFKPRYVAALQDRREQLIQEARDESIALLYNMVPAAMNAEEIQGVLESVRAVDPDITEMEMKAPLVDIAMEAAARGDEEGTVRVLDVLGEDFRNEQSKIERRLIDTQKQMQTQTEQDTIDLLVARIDAGTPTEMMRDQIESHRDRFRTDRPTQELLNRLEAREMREISNQQQDYINSMRRDIGLGEYPEGDPNKAASQIIQDMRRPSNETQHIPATTGLAMLDQLQTRMTFDAYRIGVKSKMSGDSSLPLTASYDSAIDTEFAAMGIVEAIPTENGQALIRRIPEPEAFAFASDKAGRVTNSARQLIAAGLAGDEQNATEAAQTYIALYNQNPTLANQVIENMGDQAKLRARFLQSRLPFNPTPWVEPDFLRIKPIDIDKQTLKQTIYSPDDDDPVRDSKIREMSRDFIRESLEDSDIEPNMLLTRAAAGAANLIPFVDIDTIALAPISAITANQYSKILEEEFLFARSMVDGDEQAMAMAKEWTTARFLAKYPPMLWDGELTFTSQGISAPTDLETLVRIDLKNEGFDQDAIDDLVENYRPVWDARAELWAFRDEAGVYKLAPFTSEQIGAPLYLDLSTPQEVRDIREQAEQWEKENPPKPQQSEPRRVNNMSEPFMLGDDMIDSIP